MAAALGAAFAAAIVATFVIAHPGGGGSNSGASQPSAVPRQSAAPATPSSQPSSATSSGSAPATLPGAYGLEYSKQILMPGQGGCQTGVLSAVSSVAFTAQQPVVTAYPVGAEASFSDDLYLNCDSTGDAAPILATGSNSDEIARVSGTPGEQACDAAATEEPVGTTISFSLLQPGMQFCMTTGGNQDQGGGEGQLVRLTLLSKSSTTYDLTWSVTGWSIQASNPN